MTALYPSDNTTLSCARCVTGATCYESRAMPSDAPKSDTAPSQVAPISSTDAVHGGGHKARAFHSLTSAIVQTATYTFSSSADLARYMDGQHEEEHREEYGRYGNPTVTDVEHRLARLDAAADAALFSSGMAAITTSLFALLKAGDHVLLFRDGYRRTRQFVVGFLAKYGVTHTLIEPGDLASFEAAVKPNTRLCVVEAPSNPHLYCPPIAELAAICKRHGRMKLVVDSTLATPVNLQPIKHGADLVIHSATKYLAGHNDVLAGVVAGPSHLISLVRDLRGMLGGICDPHAAFLVGRGLKTLVLRVNQQNDSALALAKALQNHSRIERVFYPGFTRPELPGDAPSQLRAGGGLLSFVVKGGRKAAAQVVDGCTLAQIAPSLGGVETLIEQPALMSYAELDDEQLAAIGIEPGLIRVSVGIEQTADIINDLLGALDKVP